MTNRSVRERRPSGKNTSSIPSKKVKAPDPAACTRGSIRPRRAPSTRRVARNAARGSSGSATSMETIVTFSAGWSGIDNRTTGAGSTSHPQGTLEAVPPKATAPVTAPSTITTKSALDRGRPEVCTAMRLSLNTPPMSFNPSRRCQLRELQVNEVSGNRRQGEGEQRRSKGDGRHHPRGNPELNDAQLVSGHAAEVRGTRAGMGKDCQCREGHGGEEDGVPHRQDREPHQSRDRVRFRVDLPRPPPT